MFRKWDVGAWTGSSWIRVVDTCECGNEPPVSIKWGGGFLD
jgi:hypothetical protein